MQAKTIPRINLSYDMHGKIFELVARGSRYGVAIAHTTAYLACMEITTFADMKVKAWNPDEIRDLVERAKAQGITQAELSSVYIGCTLGALGHWSRSGSGRRPTGAYRRALTFAELCIQMGVRPTIEEDS